MHVEKFNPVVQEILLLESIHLERMVTVDLYLPGGGRMVPAETSLLLINDGQDMDQLGLTGILEGFYDQGRLSPLLVAAIRAGNERKMEYGTAVQEDYQGWGSKAGAYTRFVMEELIPAIRARFQAPSFREKAFAGFSLGALSAMDIAWTHAHEFAKVGLFSGSFWWRTRDKNDPAYRDSDRIMHRQVEEGSYAPWLKFFFECGTEDETEDRNKNGIIDSIDDTQDLMTALAGKGYDREKDICYLEIAGGRHDVATWGRAMPDFLLWGWKK